MEERKVKITKEVLNAVLICIDNDILQFESPTDAKCSDYSFKVKGTELELIYFDDCGDWDYLSCVKFNNDVVLEYEDTLRSNEEDENDWTLNNYAVNVLEKYYPTPSDIGDIRYGR